MKLDNGQGEQRELTGAMLRNAIRDFEGVSGDVPIFVDGDGWWKIGADGRWHLVGGGDEDEEC